MFQNQKSFIRMIWLRFKMNKFMNLIGVKARNALKIKIDTKIKNKVLNDYALLLDKEKKNILIQNKKDVNLAKKNKIKENLINRLSINPIKLKGIQVLSLIHI